MNIESLLDLHRLVPGGNYMFTLAEGVEWLRRAKLSPGMDAALATLADLQARSLCHRMSIPPQ